MSSVLAVVCWPRMRELHLLSCETERQLEMVSKIWVYRASALEGEGTWQCWVLCDPSRVLALRHAASRRLALQFGDIPPTGTDSEDSPTLRIQRDMAVRRRVLCGLVGWNGYTSYAYDFECADSDEGDPLLRSFVVAEQVSASAPCASAVYQTLSELLSSNPGLAASLLSYLLTFRSWLKLREVCTRCKHMMEHNQILWAGLWSTTARPSMVAPWCSICAEEDPRRCSGWCLCGRFYCSLHGGACFLCEREACGFCLLDHATCT